MKLYFVSRFHLFNLLLKFQYIWLHLNIGLLNLSVCHQHQSLAEGAWLDGGQIKRLVAWEEPLFDLAWLAGWILVKLRLYVAIEIFLDFSGHHSTSYLNTLYGRMRDYCTGDSFSENFWVLCEKCLTTGAAAILIYLERVNNAMNCQQASNTEFYSF